MNSPSMPSASALSYIRGTGIPDMSQYVWVALEIIVIFVLVVLTVLLLKRSASRPRRDVPIGGRAEAADRAMAHSGIDPADYADVAEQQAALDRLSELPQFRRLTDGILIEWGSGARITACDCCLPPIPHLMISWGPNHAQGIVTKHGLAHYLTYQERIAAVLVARRSIPDAAFDPQEAH
jgi:hypothetical protein